ncbi:MAG: DNA polymerase III subunit delta [Verrucomicrobia bacterium GWF2_51_19]|nr:MAG: DNA polymerase III subunit delta [Verrucomicrobia bacterium GWF2_51_19]HCJ12299.1 DNA polymerase III subunit delta [Opitutae bacterium]
MADFACSFVSSNDEFLAKTKAQEIFAIAIDGLNPFAAETIDGNVQNLAELEKVFERLMEALTTPSLFGDQKVVWLRQVNFLTDSQTGKSERAKEIVEAIQEAIPSLVNTTFIISAAPVDRRTRAFKWFSTHTDFSFLEAQKDPQALKDAINDVLKKAHKGITSKALDNLLQKTDNNARLALSETEKLITFLGDDPTIDETLVHALVADVSEDFFEFVEAFFSKNWKWTLEALNRYFFNNKEGRPLLTSLQNRLRILIQIRALLDAGEWRLDSRGVDPRSFQASKAKYEPFFDSHEKSSFNLWTQNPWYLGNIAKSAQRFTLVELLSLQTAALALFESLLDSSMSQRDAFERFCQHANIG